MRHGVDHRVQAAASVIHMIDQLVLMELSAALEHRGDEQIERYQPCCREIETARGRIVLVFRQKGVCNRVDWNEQERQAKRLVSAGDCNCPEIDGHVEARHVKKRQADDCEAKQQHDPRVIVAKQISHKRHRQNDRKSAGHQCETGLLRRVTHEWSAEIAESAPCSTAMQIQP